MTSAIEFGETQAPKRIKTEHRVEEDFTTLFYRIQQFDNPTDDIEELAVQFSEYDLFIRLSSISSYDELEQKFLASLPDNFDDPELEKVNFMCHILKEVYVNALNNTSWRIELNGILEHFFDRLEKFPFDKIIELKQELQKTSEENKREILVQFAELKRFLDPESNQKLYDLAFSLKDIHPEFCTRFRIFCKKVQDHADQIRSVSIFNIPHYKGRTQAPPSPLGDFADFASPVIEALADLFVEKNAVPFNEKEKRLNHFEQANLLWMKVFPQNSSFEWTDLAVALLEKCPNKNEFLDGLKEKSNVDAQRQLCKDMFSKILIKEDLHNLIAIREWLKKA